MRQSDRGPFLQKMAGDVRVVRHQVYRLYHLRETFRRLASAFNASPALRQRWTPLHRFIFEGYTAQACLHIRRLMDQGPHRQSVSLANLVGRLVQHPDLITRDDYIAGWDDRQMLQANDTSPEVAALAQNAAAERLKARANREFDQFACPGQDVISVERLRGRLAEVEAKCERVLRYVDKQLAHYDRKKPKVPTWGHLDDAIDAMVQLFNHVSLLVTGSDSSDLVPVCQREPWEDLLTVPWVTDGSEHDD